VVLDVEGHHLVRMGVEEALDLRQAFGEADGAHLAPVVTEVGLPV